MTARTRIEDALRAHGCRQRGDSWTCPAHEDADPSLSVGVGEDGRVLLRCFTGCTPEAIVAAIGLQMADLFEPAERRDTPDGVTLAEYAEAKRLPLELLTELGLDDVK